MRSQAFEKLASLLIEAYDNDNKEAFENLKIKYHILSNREDNRAAAVVRELTNG